MIRAPTRWRRPSAGRSPSKGVGAVETLEELVAGIDGAVHSAGPKFFHFVDGGTTPAALGADWLATTLDQNPGAWVSTPLAARLEQVSIEWLKELFGLPASWGGVLTTGATMANFVALACARRWCGERAGMDVDDLGVAAAPPITVRRGRLHPSERRQSAGDARCRSRPCAKLARDEVGRVDLVAMETILRDLDGAPAIVIGSAGEVNAGDFDPLNDMADLAERHGAWFHVDGAFGLFAALSPRTKHLVEGVERADSVIADGHKWLNVPYENGFAFVRDQALLPAVFGTGAPYLPDIDEPQPNWGYRGPEMSRRARAFPVWATLRAYGREGHRAIVEHDMDLARHLADVVDAAPDLERLAEVQLNIVCFRVPARRIEGRPELDELNRRIGEAAITDGRVFFGSTTYGGKRGVPPRAGELAYAGAGRGTRGRSGARARREVHGRSLKPLARREGVEPPTF